MNQQRGRLPKLPSTDAKGWVYRIGLMTIVLALFMLLTGDLLPGSAKPDQQSQSLDPSTSALSGGLQAESFTAAKHREMQKLWGLSAFGVPSADLTADDEDSPATRRELVALPKGSVSQATLNALLEEQFAMDTDGWGSLEAYALVPSTGQVLASINAHEATVPASTYKLFIAYSMIRSVESKEYSWNDEMWYDMTLGDCFDIMITESDNDCPEAWLDMVGSEAVQAEVTRLGLSETTVGWGEMETTAYDLAKMLEVISNGTGISAANRDLLLGYMEIQEFREGVPAGVPAGVSVANKVGFLEEYLNDAAIIYKGDTEVILVLITANASWEAIANLSALVYAAAP